MKKIFLLSLLGILTLTGCSSGGGGSSSISEGSSEEATSSSEGSISSSNSQNSSNSSADSSESDILNALSYADIWSYDDEMTITLDFSKESVYAVSHYGANYNQKYSDLYFPADLEISTLNGQVALVHEVGVRMKGNTSRREFANEDGEVYIASHLKVSFKASFDDDEYDDDPFLSSFKKTWESKDIRKERKNRRLAEMEKFDLKYIPRNDGNCLNEEMYIYSSFNSADIDAPNSKPVELIYKVDGVEEARYSYQLIECVDEAFLTHHYGDEEDAQGTLYKCGWGEYQGSWSGAKFTLDGVMSNGSVIEGGLAGEEDVYNGYDPAYDLKVGEDHTLLANFLTTLDESRKGNKTLEDLEEVIDIDRFLKFEAISYLFGNFDDQRNNYNNFYLYFRPSDNKLIYIPYDWDWVFGAGSNAKEWAPLRTEDMNYNRLENPLYFLTFLEGNDSVRPSYSIDAMQEKYLEYIDTYKDELLNITTYENYLDSIGVSDKSDVDRARSYFEAKLNTINNA